MSSGGSQPVTNTTSVQLSPQQQELMDLAMPGIRQFAATVPPRYEAEGGWQGLTPGQLEAQNLGIGASWQQRALADNAANASNFLTSGKVFDPSTNPYLSQAIDATVRPITEQYQQVVRPGIRDTFQGAGQQFGGSRRNIAEGMAANSYMRNVGDASAKLVNDQYSNNLNAMVKALGLIPSTSQAQLGQAQTVGAIADTNAQQLYDRFYYDQIAPFLQSQEIMSLLSAIPGGSTTSIGSAPQRNPYTGALGGAAAGAALGSAFMPGIGTAGGAGLGALLSFL